MAVGNLVVRIGADTGGLTRGAKQAETTMQRMSNEAGKAAASLAKIGAAAIAAGSAITIGLVKSSLSAVDAQAKLAQQLGGTTSAVQTLERAADLAGVSKGALTGAVQRLNQTLGEVERKGAGPAKDALDRLGLSARELSAMDVDKRMGAIAQAMQNAGMSAQQQADALRQLGIRQSEIINLMQDGSAAFDNARHDVERFGVALTQIESKQIEQANDAMSVFGLATKGIANQLTVQFAPVLKAISDEFANNAAGAERFKAIAENTFKVATWAAGQFGDIIRGLEVIMQGLVTGALGVASGFAQMGKVLRITSETDVKLASEAYQLALNDMHELAMRELPSDAIRKWADDVKRISEEAAAEALERGNPLLPLEEVVVEDLNRNAELHEEHFDRMREMIRKQEEDKQRIIENAQGGILSSNRDFLNKLALLDQASARQRVGILSSAFADITQVAGRENRKLFEVNKAAGIANAIVATYQGAAEALKLGWPLGPIAAGAITASGLAQVSSIKSASFGGGAAPSVSSTSAGLPTTPTTSGGGTESGGSSRSVDISVSGIGLNDLFSGQQIRDLIDGINEEVGNGARIRFS
jgi:uncharacterized protein with PIN domain